MLRVQHHAYRVLATMTFTIGAAALPAIGPLAARAAQPVTTPRPVTTPQPVGTSQPVGAVVAAGFVGCSFPSNVWWQHCWGNPYNGPYTQAWMGPVEYDSASGQHHNVHLQPQGQQNQDYMNLHVSWYGVIGSGGGSQYAWRVYCSYVTVTSHCSNWNQALGNGSLFEVTNSLCLGDGYPCASGAAGDMKDCLTDVQTYGCSFTGQSWVNTNFPSLATYILAKDAVGHSGTLQNAFCDAMRPYKPCSNH